MNDSILPFATPSTVVSKIPILAKEWAWDFVKQDFALKDGRMYFVFKDETSKYILYISAISLLNSDRFRESTIYDVSFGAFRVLSIAELLYKLINIY